MTGAWWEDDDALLAAVKRAIREAEDVPPEFVEAAKTSFAWHNIDAELAALTYDSSADALAGATGSPMPTRTTWARTSGCAWSSTCRRCARRRRCRAG